VNTKRSEQPEDWIVSLPLQVNQGAEKEDARKPKKTSGTQKQNFVEPEWGTDEVTG